MAEIQPPVGEFRSIDMTGMEVDQNWDSPRIFVDGAQGFYMNQNGVVNFNLVEDLLPSPAIGAPNDAIIPHRRVVARLTMHLSQMMAIRDWLSNIITNMEQDGTIQLLKAKPDVPTKP